MKRDACCRKLNRWTALHVRAGMTTGLVQSGRRSNRNCVTSATPTVSDTTVVTAAMTTIAATMTIVVTMTGVATTATTVTTTIGGDEFHFLSNRPHLTFR